MRRDKSRLYNYNMIVNFTQAAPIFLGIAELTEKYRALLCTSQAFFLPCDFSHTSTESTVDKNQMSVYVVRCF
jgi:hypothetical protein